MNKFQFNGINADQWRNFLVLSASQFQIELDDPKIDLMRRYAKELLIANDSFNLTSITEPFEIAEKLMLDSIIPGRYIPSCSSVFDLGTGAGFPGIPLKIAFPNLTVTLLDSKRKKINFLKLIIRTLKLDGIQALQKRVEDITLEHCKYDVVISRAVMSLERFVQLSVPLLKKNGCILGMVGSEFSNKPNAIDIDKLLHMNHELPSINKADVQIIPYQLPVSGIKRSLVLIHLMGEN